MRSRSPAAGSGTEGYLPAHPATTKGVDSADVRPFGTAGPASPHRPSSIGATADVSLRLHLEVEPEASPAAIEEAIAAEGRRVARELYAAMVAGLDEASNAAIEGSKQRVEERWVTTAMGRVRIGRYRIKVGSRTLHPVDEILGLGQSEVSPGLARLVERLSRAMSYRAVSRFVGWITGEPVSPQTCMRIARRAKRPDRASSARRDAA